MPNITPTSMTVQPLVYATKSLASEYNVFFYTGARIGTFELEVDGFYVFWLERSRQGFFTAEVLAGIAKCLNTVNQQRIEQIEAIEKYEKEKSKISRSPTNNDAGD